MYIIILQSTNEDVSVHAYQFPSIHHYNMAMSKVRMYGGILNDNGIIQFTTESHFAMCNAEVAAIYAKIQKISS